MPRRIELDCGIPHRRLAAWLDDELHLERDSDGVWTFADGNGTCTIALTALEPRSFSTVAFERTKLNAEGGEATLAAFEHLFTLRFLSAGG